MDNGLLLITAGVVIINLLIVYLIIKSAINSSNIAREGEIQSKLLAKIAEKNGVTQTEINECFE